MAEENKSHSLPSSQAILIFSTVPDREHAKRIIQALLDAKLAACVSIFPSIESHYTWEGKQECSQEVLLKIKTLSDCWERARTTIAALHPYECPEILRLDVAEVSSPYREWLQTSISPF